MKASISEENGKLRIKVSADSHDERLLLSAFMREQEQTPDATTRQLLCQSEQYGWWIEVGV